MLRTGLSGGIGSGKSTVSARLAAHGAVVVDADRVAREVVEPGTPGLAQVVERFGPQVLGEDGSLDRPALGALVFADPRARRDLEAITHPLIQARSLDLFAAAPADAVVVHDVPLLVELDRGAGYALTVIVDVPEDERLRRLVQTRGMASDQARARIAAQADDEQRRAAADVLLDNSGSVEELHARVDALWHERLVPFERNLRLATPSRRPERLTLVEPDPAWADQARRLLERLGRAFGGQAVRADHIGSTSVPGLLAKDVIDLQVVVEDLEVLKSPRTRDALAQVGFVVPDGVWHDRHPDHHTAVLPKVILMSGDPARVVHCHVRPVDSSAWRLALLLRDWWRAEPEERDAYAEFKATLAARGLATSDYAAAKEPWLDQGAGRAEAWAARTGWQPEGP